MNKFDTLFAPVNSEHAIVEAIFYLEFAENITQKSYDSFIEALTSSKKIKALFSENPQLIQGFKFVVEDGKSPVAKPLPNGIKFSKKVKNETTWGLTIYPKVFTIHCLKYTRWNEGHKSPIWPQAEEILTALATLCIKNAIKPHKLGLKYIDEFIFNGTVKKYNINGLLNKEAATNLIPNRVFVNPSEARWHSHNGWFETYSDTSWGNAEILHQLDVTSGIRLNEETDKDYVSVRIEHSSAIVGTDSPLKLPSKKLESKFRDLFQILHDKNKDLVIELLTQEIKDKIKLRKK